MDKLRVIGADVIESSIEGFTAGVAWAQRRHRGRPLAVRLPRSPRATRPSALPANPRYVDRTTTWSINMTACGSPTPYGNPCPIPSHPGSRHCMFHAQDAEIAARPSAPDPSSPTSTRERTFLAGPTRQSPPSLRQRPDDHEDAPSSELPPPASTSAPDRTCPETTKAGNPCQAQPQNESPYCIYHDPDRAEQRAKMSRVGGLASGQSRNPTPLPETKIDLADRAGIQATIEAVVQLELLGRISPARSRNVLAALRIAVQNFDDPQTWDNIYRRFGPRRSLHSHPMERLNQARERLVPNLKLVGEDAPEAAPVQPSSRDEPAAN